MGDLVLDALDAIADNIFSVVQNGKDYKQNKQAYRDAGQEADDMGGLEGMRRVYYDVVERWAASDMPKTPDHFHPSELQAAWDKVGEWQW